MKYSRLKIIIENHHLSHSHCMLCHLTLSVVAEVVGLGGASDFWISVMRHRSFFFHHIAEEMRVGDTLLARIIDLLTIE